MRIHTTETQRGKTVRYGEHTQLKHRDRKTVPVRSVSYVHTQLMHRERKKKRQRLRYSERPLSEGLRQRRSYPAIIDPPDPPAKADGTAKA